MMLRCLGTGGFINMKRTSLAVFTTLILAASITPLAPIFRDGNPYPLCPPSHPNCTGVVPGSEPSDIPSNF